MMRKLLMLLLLTGFFMLTFAQKRLPDEPAAAKAWKFTQPKMGSPFIITIYHTDSAVAAAAAARAFAKVDTLNQLFSDYMDSSELNKLSAASGGTAYRPVPPLLFNLLQRSVKAAALSHGSFDITIGPIVRLWRKARKTGVFPDSAAVRQALQRTGYRYIHLDTLHRTVWLEKAQMQLDLGGIAKGYAAQQVLDYLQTQGLPIAMVDAGGDLVTGKAPPGRAGWHIGINEPEKENLMPRLLQLQQLAVATSGDMYQYIEYKGQRYSHIVNPRTGMGVTAQRNVTVIAADGATADWLATACSILPVQQALDLVKQFKNAALLITENKNGHIIQIHSPNFNRYLM